MVNIQLPRHVAEWLMRYFEVASWFTGYKGQVYFAVKSALESL